MKASRMVVIAARRREALPLDETRYLSLWVEDGETHAAWETDRTKARPMEEHNAAAMILLWGWTSPTFQYWAEEIP